MARKVNAATLAHIKRSEGLRLEAYPDPGSSNGDPWTIGYGSTKGVKRGMVITEADAEQRLVDDLTFSETTVSKLVKVPLNDNQFGALVSFVFNIGAGAFQKSTLLKVLNAGGYKDVPAQLRRWTKNDGKEMKGLVNRREAEIALWFRPPDHPIPVKELPPSPAAEASRQGGCIAIAALVAFIIAAIAILIFVPIFPKG